MVCYVAMVFLTQCSWSFSKNLEGLICMRDDYYDDGPVLSFKSGNNNLIAISHHIASHRILQNNWTRKQYTTESIIVHIKPTLSPTK